MPKRPRKRRPKSSSQVFESLADYAAALGRKGGLKGGKARMNALSPAERSELARRAARARWSKAKKKS